MLDIFISLVGDVSDINYDLLVTMAFIFYLFLVTEFCRFIEIAIDYIFKRR